MNPRQRAARRRRVAVLIIVCAGLLGGLAIWQARARARYRVTSPDALIIEALSPALRLASPPTTGGDDMTPRPGADDIRTLPPAVRTYLAALEKENVRLAAALDLRDSLPDTALAALVIARSNVPWQGYLLVDKGERDGVVPRMVALTPDGIVGQVIAVTAHTARLMPITYPVGGVGALAPRTGAVGILEGTKSGRCELRYVPKAAGLRAGDLVITSGLGGVFPRGFPLGTVTEVTDDEALSTVSALVIPKADATRVREVVLLK